MADVVKLADGKSELTLNNRTMHGIESCISDSEKNTLTFYIDNRGYTVNYEEIDNKQGQPDAKSLGNYYLLNNFFFSGRTYP